MCTEKSIQLEPKGIQPGGTLPKNFGCMILGRSVDPGWRMTPAKFALFSGESSFRYTQDIGLHFQGWLFGVQIALKSALRAFRTLARNCDSECSH